MPTWHEEADLKNCRKLVKEYFAKLKKDRPPNMDKAKAPQQSQQLGKTKATVHPAEPASSVRRSARLRKLVQSVMQCFNHK